MLSIRAKWQKHVGKETDKQKNITGKRNTVSQYVCKVKKYFKYFIKLSLQSFILDKMPKYRKVTPLTDWPSEWQTENAIKWTCSLHKERSIYNRYFDRCKLRQTKKPKWQSDLVMDKHVHRGFWLLKT